jgi:hypothetical protein
MILHRPARDLHQNLPRAFLPCHPRRQMRVQDRRTVGRGQIGVAPVGDFRTALQRDLQQVEPAQLPRRDPRARAVFDIVQRQPFPRQMVVAGIKQVPRPQRFQPVRAEHRRHPLARLIKVAGAKQSMMTQ